MGFYYFNIAIKKILI